MFLAEGYNGLFPSVHRAVDDTTLLRPPCHVPRLSPDDHPSCCIDNRQFRESWRGRDQKYLSNDTSRARADSCSRVNPLDCVRAIKIYIDTRQLLNESSTRSLIPNNLHLSFHCSPENLESRERERESRGEGLSRKRRLCRLFARICVR